MVLPGKIMVFYSWIRRFIHDLPPVSRSVSTSRTSPTSSIQIRPLTGRQQSDVPQQLGEVYTASARLGSMPQIIKDVSGYLAYLWFALGLYTFCNLYVLHWFIPYFDFLMWGIHMFIPEFSKGEEMLCPEKPPKTDLGGWDLIFLEGPDIETPPAMNFLVAFCCLGGGNKNWSDFFSISSS